MLKPAWANWQQYVNAGNVKTKTDMAQVTPNNTADLDIVRYSINSYCTVHSNLTIIAPVDHSD